MYKQIEGATKVTQPNQTNPTKLPSSDKSYPIKSNNSTNLISTFYQHWQTQVRGFVPQEMAIPRLVCGYVSAGRLANGHLASPPLARWGLNASSNTIVVAGSSNYSGFRLLHNILRSLIGTLAFLSFVETTKLRISFENVFAGLEHTFLDCSEKFVLDSETKSSTQLFELIDLYLLMLPSNFWAAAEVLDIARSRRRESRRQRSRHFENLKLNPIASCYLMSVIANIPWLLPANENRRRPPPTAVEGPTPVWGFFFGILHITGSGILANMFSIDTVFI
ncbi:hypothetical protein R3P38DRAFT_2779492 [Favolaschia claudopus]|uniref:Uncharacterized protein n=1 Tax=Favolaschia claudopus TaxID=2862362 RepID=A0AAW0BG18_9AGAR